ncbi:MAG: hypothetical protein JKY50_00250 [Oleispira sp.]|nr:hypothetical protein [Oleispira sp.]
MTRKLIGFKGRDGSSHLFSGGTDSCGNPFYDGTTQAYGIVGRDANSDFSDFITSCGDMPIYATPDIKVLQEARDLLAYKKTLKPKWIKYDITKDVPPPDDTLVYIKTTNNNSGEDVWRASEVVWTDCGNNVIAYKIEEESK